MNKSELNDLHYILIGLSAILLTICLAEVIMLLVSKYRRKKQMEEEKEKLQQEKEKQDALINLSKLLPVKLFQELEINKLSEISMSPQKYINSVVLEVNAAEFGKAVQRMQAQEVFTYINHMLNEIVPIVCENGGTIDKFDDAGFTAFFFENYEKSLETAVSICEVKNKLTLLNQEYDKFSVGLCYGSVMVGVVGQKKRMSLLTVSEFTGLSIYLQSIAGKYYANILITGSYAELIDHFSEKFNSRFVGYIYMNITKSIEKIYDVFDGDPIETRNRKRRTKILFEKGVALFSQSNFEEARSHFIEVLKTDRFDRAAKEYLYLCDKYINQDINQEKQIFIESY
ncbi:nucleotidyl cyclase domain-containing protein [Anaeromicropila populeti]|uniref:Guanylate cyclase domain-containing protein n=1 Tax=Anaeromicropila populeti TaxID=37658 RepID=A0A1I6LTY3_9FIRM|nr:hypothetical protein [Anaeromicropila populeti]SFS06931.1 hypothetical protein SAMN05661086_03564 [Anaeromicropila populeti]